METLSVVPASDPLLGPRLKVQRAKRHFREYEAEFKKYVDGSPAYLQHRIDPATGEDCWHIRDLTPPPHDFGIIAGDIVHNLRSALDQLVCGLVRANRRQVATGMSFPIMGSAQSFSETAPKKLKNVSVKAEQFIRDLKPYKGGNDLLWTLSELSNMDKHNKIIGSVWGRLTVEVEHLLPFTDLPHDADRETTAPFVFGRQKKVLKATAGDIELHRSLSTNSGIQTAVDFEISIVFQPTRAAPADALIGETCKQLIELVDGMLATVEQRVL